MKPAKYIDVHHHFVPPGYAEYANTAVQSAKFQTPLWSREIALSTMDQFGVATSMLSLSTPGVNLGDVTEARKRARKYNELAANEVAAHPKRFGLFAVLTLPDVEGSIAEAIYALDTLKADGVILLANANGQYLGDPAVEPLLAELDRRKAVVFVHPSALQAQPVALAPPFMADFLLDTTRTAITLVRSGAMKRYPNMKIILAHGGGFLPFAVYRFAGMISAMPTPGGPPSLPDVLAQFRSFYFDTTSVMTPSAYPSLLTFAQPDRILFGSDWPYAPTASVAIANRMHEAYALSLEQRQAIDRGNALKLFPRLA